MIPSTLRAAMGVLLAATVGPWGCQPEAGGPPVAEGLPVVSTPLPDTSSLRLDWTRAVPELDSARIAVVRLGTDGAIWVVARDGRVVRIDQVDDTSILFPAAEGLESPTVSAAAPDPRGGIWVRDGTSGWILNLSTDGTWTRELRTGAGPLLWGRRALATDDQGRLWVGIHPDTDSATPLDVPRPVYARLEDGTLLDTLYLPEAVTEACARRDPNFRSGWLEDFRERYVPFPQWALLPSGALAAGCPATYTVDIGNAPSREGSRAGSASGSDEGASPRLSLAMDAWLPVPVGPDERNDFRTTWTALMRTRGTPGAETMVMERCRSAFIQAGLLVPCRGFGRESLDLDRPAERHGPLQPDVVPGGVAGRPVGGDGCRYVRRLRQRGTPGPACAASGGSSLHAHA